ncbi:MAG: membrane protein insertase YidC [Pontiellaceae bacterium]|nr:membrane protein insertase YidC [Pontiellaceae bacterium]MBN2786286.1 membrane protein insertase YidC [Pontiellaceae bacterium]
MNKKDLLPVILLALLIPAWMFFDSRVLAPKFADKSAPAAIEQSAENTEIPITAGAAEIRAAENVAEAVETVIPEPREDEVVVVLKNDKVELELTSFGGGIKSATLLDYPEFDEENSPKVQLSFTNAPAMTYTGLAGMEYTDALNIEVSEDGLSAILRGALENGIFERTITLGDGYTLTIKDRFSATADDLNLPAFRIYSGRMENPADTKAMKGMSILGADSYSASDDSLNYWGRRIEKLFKNSDSPVVLTATPDEMRGVPVDWVSAKNKFFTQIIALENSTATMAIRTTRDTNHKRIVPHNIASALVFEPTTVQAGSPMGLNYTYYIGPKKYSTLKEAGNNFEGVMEFKTIGKMAFMNWLMEPARKILLWTLNFFFGIFHNYGVAIIITTLLVRILFWPLTHKSTDKMRENSEKMQEVQPKVKALQEKYKNNPTKLREETMKVYQEHGFNPMGMMGGCLPMFVQLPVFIALYTVLRNAIELRYMGFLWISDLSTPENLFMDKIPFIHSLNILPIVMAASMVWQQKLSSPTSMAATPEQQQQQKMMMIMMPVMMLFFFYSMPSGLVLYWTTSNLLMIGQTVFRNARKKRAKA